MWISFSQKLFRTISGISLFKAVVLFIGCTTIVVWKSFDYGTILNRGTVSNFIWKNFDDGNSSLMDVGTHNGSFNNSALVVHPKVVFVNAQAREVALSHSQLNVPANFTSAKPKIIYLATLFMKMENPNHFYYLHPGRQSFEDYKCPYSNCLVTRDQKDLQKSDAVLFHLRDIEIASFPDFRSPPQKWILYTMEPPWLDLIDMDKLDGLFNWTMSYRTNSDVVVKYGFVARRQGNSPSTMRTRKKEKFAVWFVSDCCTQSRREEYVKELRKHVSVDVFGGCGKKIPCGTAESKTCYDTLLPKYMFYLSFENAICKDYVTEKFFNALEQDVIPVTFGGANYSSLAPSASYINALDFASPRHLAEYLQTVANNQTLYESYFIWKRTFRAYLHAWPCDLCAKLHLDSARTTVRTDLRQWWVNEAKCKGWTNEGITQNLSSVLPCYRKKIF